MTNVATNVKRNVVTNVNRNVTRKRRATNEDIPEPMRKKVIYEHPEVQNALRIQTTNPNLTYGLEDELVRYRPPGYTVQLENGKDPRDILLVTFPKPFNLFHMYDTDNRVFLGDHMAFYQTTASSGTSKLEELRDTWFPTLGLTPNYDIIKVTSLVTKRGSILTWKPFLDMYVNLQLKLDRKADQKQDPYFYKFGIEGNSDLLMNELAIRTGNWDFLRISASIGLGIWKKETSFRTFVMERQYVKREFIEEPLVGFTKSPVFKTTQIYPVATDEPLLKCRLEPVFSVKHIIDGNNDVTMVTLDGLVDGLVRLDRLGSAPNL
jgi:hypothetical protein